MPLFISDSFSSGLQRTRVSVRTRCGSESRDPIDLVKGPAFYHGLCRSWRVAGFFRNEAADFQLQQQFFAFVFFAVKAAAQLTLKLLEFGGYFLEFLPKLTLIRRETLGGLGQRQQVSEIVEEVSPHPQAAFSALSIERVSFFSLSMTTWSFLIR